MLEKKRNKMRMVQQRKISDLSSCIELPKDIPLQLVIGSKVTARLRKPQDGLFTGSIDAVDTSNNTYRITFERPGLGTHSIPDYEVLVRKLFLRNLLYLIDLLWRNIYRYNYKFKCKGKYSHEDMSSLKISLSLRLLVL